MICPKPTGVQVMAAAVLEEDTETIPDIYGSGRVFDDIDQQVRMVSMHEDTTRGIDEVGSDTEELGQYYMGSMENEEYYEEDIIIEDTVEPFNCFSVRFVEDALEADAAGMAARVQEKQISTQRLQQERKTGKDHRTS